MKRSAFAQLLPHTGPMCLLDQVLEWDAGYIRCSATSHRDPANPLAVAGRLHAVCGVEYAAQAIALHAALGASVQGAAAVPGYLGGIRRLQLARTRLDDVPEELIVQAERQLADHGGLVYDFSIAAAGTALLDGRLSILFPKRPAHHE